MSSAKEGKLQMAKDLDSAVELARNLIRAPLRRGANIAVMIVKCSSEDDCRDIAKHAKKCVGRAGININFSVLARSGTSDFYLSHLVFDYNLPLSSLDRLYMEFTIDKGKQATVKMLCDVVEDILVSTVSTYPTSESELIDKVCKGIEEPHLGRAKSIVKNAYQRAQERIMEETAKTAIH